MQAAWLNVRINTGMIRDRKFADEMDEKGKALLLAALPAADEIYLAVEAKLAPKGGTKS
jgi:formiminotetrahydrofolate cyclodeaminase